MDKQLAKKAESIIFVKVENDGFDLGAQRRPIEKNDLTQALAILQQYKQALQNGENVSAIFNNPEASKIAVIAEKVNIAKNGDYNLSGERYKETIIRKNTIWPLVELREICYLVGGGTPSRENKSFWENGNIKWVSAKHIDDIYLYNSDQSITEEAVKNSSTNVIDKDTIILVTRVSVGKMTIAKNKFAINQDLTGIVIKDTNKVNVVYLFRVLESLINQIEQSAQGLGVKGVTRDYVRTIKIPLPPLEVQQEIVVELESYQKIIEGAKQIVENYKPTIKIDPDWESVELGRATTFISSGSTPLGGKENYLDNGILFIRSQNILKGRCDFSDAVYISPETHASMQRSQVKQFDVFLNITGASIGRSALMRESVEANVNQHVAVIRVQEEKLLPAYLTLILNSDMMQKRINEIQNGASRQALNYEQIKQLTIPLPSLDTQRQIVAEIEQEQKRIQTTKELAEIFEQKIKDKIAEVWGEEPNPILAPTT